MSEFKIQSRILVVDDDPINRGLIATQLMQLRGMVVEAEDGREAWAALTSQPFDLAVVDLNMPNMDGFELIQCIRGFPRTRHLPIVVVTSRTDNASVERALAAGATSFLTKPLSWTTFRSHIAFLMKLTDEARRSREGVQQAKAISSANEQVLGGVCLDVAASAERIAAAIKQASIKSITGETSSAFTESRLRKVLEEAQYIVATAQSACELVEKVNREVGALNEPVAVDDIFEGCREQVKHYADELGISLSLTPPATAITMFCNRAAVELALQHLLKNAITHSRRGNAVRMTATAFPDGLLGIEISDTGEGMHPDFVARQISPLSLKSNHDGGHFGRGWPIAKAVAEAHNGKFEIRSMQGAGTSAFVFLPPERMVSNIPRGAAPYHEGLMAG